MAEAFVSKFAEKFCDFLSQQVVFCQDECRQLEQAEYVLSCMQSFLQDVDSKEMTSDMKKLVSEVRDLTNHAEEVIDNFIIRKVHPKRRRLLHPFYASFDKWAQWKLGNEIEEINKKFHDLPQRILNYGIGNLGDLGEEKSTKGGSLQERRRTSPLLKDLEVVGIKNDIQTLVAQLTGGDSRLQVVSIVGMAGLGKTTLARKVYNNGTVKRHFNSCAWVYVSQEYNINHLLQSILMQFGIPKIKESQMNDLQLQERLFEHLIKTRCLLVLDDVWDCKAWDDFEPFMNANSGSRILLTTRHKAVTLNPHTTDYELQCLGKDESWKLLCMITFPEQGMKCPQNLEHIGKEILAKCHGLPLAIVVMGGLLSGRKRHVCEWQNVLRSISSQLVKRNPKIEEILDLSYKDLPYHLKLCFLYLGIFPEDHEFYAEKLMRLWVAEGFISPIQCETMEKTMEEVAEDYLDELIRRNLVQVAKRSSIGQVRSCRMHDLLRDLSISKAKEIKFLHVNEHSPPSSKVRRLALYHKTHQQSSFHSPTTCLHSSTTRLRSLSCFIPAGDGFSENQEKLLYGSFKFLKVLNLYGVLLRELPDEIDALILLKYLGCRRTELESLPSSIGSLSNLQTLDVTSSNIVKIPSVIWKMQQLRHFHVKGIITECDNPPLQLDFPSNLQTLTHLEVSKWVNDYLGKLNNLSELGMWGKDSSEYRSGLSNTIPILKKLRYLKLGEWDDCSIPTLPPLMDHQNLYKLFLHGKLEELPESDEFPPNLTKLTLRKTKLEHDPMPTLERLKKLRILKLLDEAYSGEEMICSAQGFPQLESLDVVYLNKLEEWKVDQGAMPSLQHLRINYCMKLRGLPEGLQHRASLTLERKPPEQESNNEDGGPDLV